MSANNHTGDGNEEET